MKHVRNQLKDILVADFHDSAEKSFNKRLVGFEYRAVGRDHEDRMGKILEKRELIDF